MSIFNIGWLAIGFFICSVYAAFFIRTAQFVHGAVPAEGTVIDTEPHRSVSFQLPDRSVHVFTQNGRLDAQVGEHVPIGYLAANPEQTARVTTFGALWAIQLNFLPVVLGFGIAPIVGVILDEKARRRRP